MQPNLHPTEQSNNKVHQKREIYIKNKKKISKAKATQKKRNKLNSNRL